MSSYKTIPPLPDTGGGGGGGTSTSKCSKKNIVPTNPDLSNSQDIDLNDCILNGQGNKFMDYLPNNNVCDNISVINTTNHLNIRKEFYESECKSENEQTQLVDSSGQNFIKNVNLNSLCQSDTIIESTSTIDSMQEPQTTQHIESEEEEEEGEEENDSDRFSKSSEYNSYNNGTLKKSHKRKQSSRATARATGSCRGRPRKPAVTMYHSQISDKNGIKLRIKKSNLTPRHRLTPNKRKSGRRKKTKAYSDTDNSDYERKPKRNRSNVTSTDNAVSSTQNEEPLEQSPWGNASKIPENVLEKIFMEACMHEGSLPLLVRLCKVCRLWRDTSLKLNLWKKADLNYVKEKCRTDLRIHWLILNRLTECEDLNMGEWKVRDIQSVLEAICEHCPKLKGLNLSGWKGLNADNLKYLSNECKKLERLDLSAINSTSAINAQPLVLLSQTMNTRLTHLVLAHNKIAGFMQVAAAISNHCPNLQLLDISNIKTSGHNTALLHVEKLQIGCPKLRVLRITNSQIWLAPCALPDQVASPGFPMLEELSLAGIEEDQTTTSRSMDDNGIERLLKSSTKLRLLDVRGCSKLSDSGLVRVPAWDLEHLFLSACYITRLQNSGLELIVQKWSHSLLEVDLAWSTATASLDAAVLALAEKGPKSKLRILNLCGSSVSLEPIKAVLSKCPSLYSINLQSCRALPRGIKRLYTGPAVAELRKSLNDRKENASDSEENKSTGTSPKY